MGKIKENQQKKRQQLFETAFDLFTSKGIHETTIQDIAKAAGVAKGTFYLYFKDKYDLIDKLRKKKTAKLFEEAINFSRTVQYDNFTEQLLIIIEYIIDEFSNNQDLLRFIYKNLSLGMGLQNIHIDTDKEQGENTTSSIYEIFEERVKQDGLELKDPRTTLFLVIELVGSTCYNAILFDIPLPIEEFKPSLNEAVRKLLNE
ncbi:TetR/AcrR family transcriptional regulator [Niameybacter massiliensis]|uniref:TetR/AcrR family transcriptional regulator n=1 Tax=Holtiella tumoricola TaxID=3018743 RepID=A0AA42DRJ8_9FIRM|nr:MULTISPECIES: TetR/AcrR family transcriptional regulator [Lachnospirales]MDA3734129.1 TetR/AcrR family transcriptional regulator [Holtiella tumoricola]